MDCMASTIIPAQAYMAPSETFVIPSAPPCGMMPKPVTVFSHSGSNHCKEVKKHLANQHIPFNDIDIGKYPEKRLAMYQLTGNKTVPQIFFYNTHMGGFTDFEKIIGADKLHETLHQAEANWDGTILQSLQLPLPGRSVYDAPAAMPMDPFIIGRNTVTYDELVYDMRNKQSGLNIAQHRHILKGNPLSFTGAELVNWLRVRYGLATEGDAIAVASQLMQLKMFHPVMLSRPLQQQPTFAPNATLYRLQEDEDYVYRRVLNERRFWCGASRNGSAVAQHLRFRVARIYEEHTSSRGVDYLKMVQSDEFHTFVDATGELQGVDMGIMQRNEKIAFLINVFNTMVIHAFAVLGAPKSGRHRYHFMHSVHYNIGGYKYSLNDIYHGLLRGNRTPPFALSTKPFIKNDPRTKYMVVPPDPRIHFALNFGAKSCPIARAFAAHDLDQTLELQTEAFLERTTQVDAGRKKIVVSKLFHWYQSDFGGSKFTIAQFISQHLPPTSFLKQAVDTTMQGGRFRSFKMKFFEWDWETNADTTNKPLSVRQLKIVFGRQLAWRRGACATELAEWEMIGFPEGEAMLLQEIAGSNPVTPVEALAYFGPMDPLAPPLPTVTGTPIYPPYSSVTGGVHIATQQA